MAKTQSQAFKLDAICAKLKTYRGNEGPLDNNANNTETSSGHMDKDFMDMGKMDPGEEQTPLKNKRKNFHPRNISHFEDQCQNLEMDGNDYELRVNNEKLITQHDSPSSSEPELKYSLLAQTHMNLSKCLSEGLPKKPPEKEDNIPMDLSFKQARDGHNLYSSGDIIDLSISKLEVPSISLSNYATYKQSSALELDSASAVLSEYAASLNRNIKINIGNKDEPTGNSADASAMKDYAENTMKELLSIYGLNDMAETITKSVPLSSFSSGKILERHLTEEVPHLEANVVKGCPLQPVPSNSQNVNPVSNVSTPVNPPEVSPGLQYGEGLYESLRSKVVDSMQKLANLPPNHIIGNPRVILPPNMATILTLAALNSKTNSQESSVPSSQPIHRPPPPHTGNCVQSEVVPTLSSHKPLPADYSRYVKRYSNATECGGSHCKDLNYREHFHCLDCNYKVFLKKEEMIRHFKWHKKRDESLQHGFLRFSPMDDCSEKFSQCAHNKKQTHYHCLKDGCDKVYISTSDVQMHANYHRKDSAIIQEGFQRFRATEDCGSTTCFFYGQRTTHFHCRRQGCNFTFKNKADMEKHKSYHIKDEQLNRDGFKKFMKHEHCTFPNCRFSKVCNHIHCIRPGCSYVLHSSGQLYSHKRKHERRDNEIAYRKFKWSQGMKIPSPEGSPSPLLNTSLGILTPKSEPMEPEIMSKSEDGADSSESESIPPSSNASITCQSSEMPSTSISNISDTLPKSFAQFATLLTGVNLNNSLNLSIPSIPSQQVDYNSSGSEEWKIDEKTQSDESSPPPSQPSHPPTLVMSPLQLQHSPLQLQNSPHQLQHSPLQLQNSPQQLQHSPLQLQNSPHQLQHSPLPLQSSPLQLQHSPLPLQQSAFQLHQKNQDKKPKSDDSWKKYLTRYTANDPCKPRCDLLYKDHYHCISPGCYTTFKSKDGVREHSRCHEQQDQITPLYFQTSESKQPCSYPNCPFSLRETHHHCTWDNCNEIILASDCTFRRLDHFKIHEYSKKMTFHHYSPSMSITTTSDGVFKRKRGRPPKNRVIEVSLATVSNSHQAPQAIFTSFKLPKIGSNIKNSNNFFNMSPSMSHSLSSHLSSTLKLKPMTSNSLTNRANIEIQDGFYIFPEFSSCPDVLCPFYSKLHYHCTQPRCFYITDRSDILVLHSKDFHDNIEIWEGFVFFDRSIDCRLLGCHSNKVNRHFHCTRPNCNYSFVRYSTMAIHEQKHKEIAAGMPLIQKIKFPKPKTASKENGANFNTNETIPQKQVVKAKGTFYPLSSLPTNKIEVRPEQSDNTSIDENLNNSEDIQGSGNHEEMEPKSITLPKPPPQAYVHHSEWDTALQHMFTCAEQNCPHVMCQLNHRDHYHCHHCNQAFVSSELLKPHLLHHLNPPDISSSDTESSEEENEEQSPLIRHSTPLYGNNSLSLSLNLNPSFFCNAMSDLKEKCQSPSHIMQINEKAQTPSHDSYLNRKSLSQEFDNCNGEESEDRSFISQDSKEDSYDLSQPDSPNSRRPARKRSQPSKHDDYVDSKRIKIVSPRFMKDEPVPEGYIRFRFNEDCRYSHCGYREHQTHFHCMRSDCGYSFCDKTRFVQHTARHERLDTLMGDEFQQFRTNIMCERSNCTYTGKSSHFHCLKCDFVCTDTNKVVAHRRHHSKLDSIAAAGFSKFMANQDCQNKACNYSQKQTHYHCLKCQTGVLGLSQMESHKYKHIE